MTATKVLELALLYNFVTELTSFIVVADDNFTLGDGPNDNGALYLGDSLGRTGGPVPGGVPIQSFEDFYHYDPDPVGKSNHDSVFHLHKFGPTSLSFYVVLPKMKLCHSSFPHHFLYLCRE
jgi:hypothetical protein